MEEIEIPIGRGKKGYKNRKNYSRIPLCLRYVNR